MSKQIFKKPIRIFTIIGMSLVLMLGLISSGFISNDVIKSAFAGTNCPSGSIQGGNTCYSCPAGESFLIPTVNTCTKPNAKTCPLGYTGPSGGQCTQITTTYSCLNGVPISGTNCIAQNKTTVTTAYTCPQGGQVQANNCVATNSSPVDFNDCAAIYPESQVVLGNPGTPTYDPMIRTTVGSNYCIVYFTSYNPLYNPDVITNASHPITTVSSNSCVTNLENGLVATNIMILTPSGYQICAQHYPSSYARSQTTSFDRLLFLKKIYSNYTYPGTAQTSQQCPNSWTDAGGANCYQPAQAQQSTNTQPGICPSGYISVASNSNDCQHASTVVTSGVTYTPESSDISNGSCPNVIIGQLAACTFTISNPTSYPLSPNASAQIQGVSSASSSVSMVGNNLIISNLPTTGGAVSTGLPVTVKINANNYSPSPTITLDPIIATGSILDSTLSCTPDTQTIGGLITCSGTLPTNTVANNPVVKVGTTGNPVSCTQSGSLSAGKTLSCIGINVGQTTGLQDIFITTTGTSGVNNVKIDTVRVTSAADIDGDGIPNVIDADVDGDCGLDISYDKTKPNCLNGNDIDGNGIIDGLTGVDAQGNIVGMATGCNGLSTPGCMIDGTGKPFDSTKIDQDIDGDGIINTQDIDIDGDGIPNQNDTDSDNDGFVDPVDQDSDNDGTPNTTDTTPRGPGSGNITMIDIASNVANSGNCTGQDLIIGTPVNCDFPLTGNSVNTYQVPNGGISASITTATGTSSCTISENGQPTVHINCLNIPSTGGTAGIEPVKLNTIQKGSVNLKVATTPATQAILTDTLICTPNPTFINTKVICAGQLPANVTADGLKVSINSNSVDCTISSLGVITCPEISVGSNVGQIDVKASTTTLTVPFTVDTIQVLNNPLKASDVAGITFICGINNNLVVVNNLTDCRFILPADKSLPTGFKLSISDGTPVLCTASGQTVTCNDVPTGSKVGSEIIYAYIDGTKINTGETVVVNDSETTTTITPTTTPTPTKTTTLPRTGGVAIISASIFVVTCIGILGFAFVNRQKEKNIKF